MLKEKNMKAVFRKALAFMLASAVVLSCAFAGFAAAASESAGNLEITSEILSQASGEWVKAETVSNGETVKARVYVGTDYFTNAGELMFFYSSDLFEDSYTKNQIVDIAENDYYKSLVGLDASAVFYSSDSKAIKRLLDNGFITEEFALSHNCVAINYMFSAGAKNTVLKADEWFAEFELKVKDGAEACDGEFIALISTVQSPDSPYGYINVPVGEENGYVENTVSFGDVFVDVTVNGSAVRNYNIFSFDVNGGSVDNSGEKAEYKVLIGESFDINSVVPEKEGHSFVGWTESTDPDSANKEYIAEWKVNSYTVSFNTNGGDKIDAETLEFGEKIILPEPERTGYKFVGWSSGGRIYPAGYEFTVPAKNVTMTAMWLVNSRSLKYYIGGEEFSFSVAVGQEIPMPDMSGLEAVEILYWVDGNGEETEIPDVMPDNDLVFTAVVKYNHESASGVTASFDNGAFGGDENGITFNASLKPYTSQGGTDFGGKNYKQIANYDIGFKRDNADIEPENGKAEISIPVPSAYAGRTDFIVARLKDNGTYEKVNAVLKNGKLVFSASEFGEIAVFVKSETSIKTLPSKLSYNYKDGLDLSGLELETVDENGNKKTVSDTSKMKASGYNPKKIGTQTVTVEYDGTSVSFNVTVSYAWWQMIIRILLLGFLWY